MNKKARSRKFTAKQSARLGAYFAAGVGASMIGTSDAHAVIVPIDVASFSGPNGGLDDGTYADFSLLGGTFRLYNNVTLPLSIGERFGLAGVNNFALQAWMYYGYASPRNFPAGFPVGPDIPFGPSRWTADDRQTLFRVRMYGSPPFYGYGTYMSPDFGPGSYLAFRVESGGQFNYGYFEVTWSQATSTFEILSGAYESEFNKAITAGGEAIPEPGTWAAAALLAGGAAYARWRRRKTS